MQVSGDNESLGAVEPYLLLKRFLPRAGALTWDR